MTMNLGYYVSNVCPLKNGHVYLHVFFLSLLLYLLAPSSDLHSFFSHPLFPWSCLTLASTSSQRWHYRLWCHNHRFYRLEWSFYYLHSLWLSLCMLLVLCSKPPLWTSTSNITTTNQICLVNHHLCPNPDPNSPNQVPITSPYFWVFGHG